MPAAKGAIQRFFFPSLTPWLVVRIGVVAFFAYLFFGHVCVPFQIQGSSMEPTYTDGGFNFCWRGRYLFFEPRRYDVVTVRFAGTRVMLLKRIVALEGEQVEFRGGKLFVSEKEIEEPYVHNRRNWNLSPRYVEQGCVFVVGDNRGVAIENHSLGQASKQRITGGAFMVNGKWVLGILMVATGIFGAFSLFPSEEKKVKKQFSLLAEYTCKEEGEKILAMAGKMRNLEFLFYEPFTVEAPPYSFSGSLTRGEIASLAARARLNFSQLTLEFHDLSISFPEKEKARAVLTGRVRGKTMSGEAVHEVREMECLLKKNQDQWLFEHWEIVEVLKR